MIKLADYDFLAATPSSMAGWSAARGGGGGTGEATYFDAAGNLQVATAGQWRVDHDPVTLARRGLLLEAGRTNRIRNSRMEGAVVGVPGSAPTNFTFAGTGGVDFSIVGFGAEKGIPYLDFRLSGTSTTGGSPLCRLEGFGQAIAAQNQIWTHSAYFRLVAGSLTGITSVNIAVTEWDALNAFVAQGFTAYPSISSGLLAGNRILHTRTLSGAATTQVRPSISFSVQTLVGIDATFRIGAPQHELGAFATSPILPPVGVTTVAATRQADQGSVPVAATSRATLYLEERTIAKGASGSLGALQADDGSANNRLSIAATGGTGYAPAIAGSGTAIATFSTAAITDGVVDRVAVAYAPNAMAAALDGASLGFDTSGVLAASINRIAIAEGDRTRHLRLRCERCGQRQ
jgi:hypothetical protein